MYEPISYVLAYSFVIECFVGFILIYVLSCVWPVVFVIIFEKSIWNFGVSYYCEIHEILILTKSISTSLIIVIVALLINIRVNDLMHNNDFLFCVVG